MDIIRYDFEDLFSLVTRILNSNDIVDPMILRDLKSELNAFFTESKCKDIIYTNNSDKLFFGVCVMPVFDTGNIYNIMQGEKPIRIEEYYLEIDSKLFSPQLELVAPEIAALLIHEIGHMVNTGAPIETLRKNVDQYLLKEDEILQITDVVHYHKILSFGVKDALRKITSIFERDDEEVIADAFMVSCGFGDYLESAFNKIVRSGLNTNRYFDNKFVVLSWCLRLYKDVKYKRIASIRSLNKFKELCACRLDKREMEVVIRSLERIDDSALLEASFVDTIGDKYDAIIRDMKRKGISSFESDYYEFALQANNIEYHDDALLMVRSVNSRISIIDDYISSEKLSPSDSKRWNDLLSRYMKLRDQISSKVTYKDKYSRINISYPQF